jgi:peptidoglycan/LPS O-acetylase OafA/YrhL
LSDLDHSRSYYRPELDALRLYAFLLVYLNHSLPSGANHTIDGFAKNFAALIYQFANACRFGLSLFFTLSAFLICELLIREKRAVGTVKVRQFYIRRILRIWPLYYFALGLGLILCFLPGAPTDSLSKLGYYAVFLGAWSTVHLGWIDNPVYPLWSISVEEQFYLLAPLFIKFFDRRSIRRFCFIIIAVANCCLFYLGWHRVDDDGVWPNAFVQFECFAAGILLSLALNGRLPRLQWWKRLLLFACSWPCWLLAWRAQSVAIFALTGQAASWLLVSGYALASLGSVMVLYSFLGAGSRRFPAWVIYLGRISFGLYVFHAFAIELMHAILPHSERYSPVMFALRLGITLGVTVIMAALSYRIVETPLLRIKKRHTVIESSPLNTTKSTNS